MFIKGENKMNAKELKANLVGKLLKVNGKELYIRAVTKIPYSSKYAISGRTLSGRGCICEHKGTWITLLEKGVINLNEIDSKGNLTGETRELTLSNKGGNEHD